MDGKAGAGDIAATGECRGRCGGRSPFFGRRRLRRLRRL